MSLTYNDAADLCRDSSTDGRVKKKEKMKRRKKTPTKTFPKGSRNQKKKKEKNGIRRRGFRSDCTFRPVQMCFVLRQMCRTNETPTTTHHLSARRATCSRLTFPSFRLQLLDVTQHQAAFPPLVSSRRRGFQPSLCTSLPWFPSALKTSAPRFVAPSGQLRSLIESCLNASLCYAAAGEMRSFVQAPLLSLSLSFSLYPRVSREDRVGKLNVSMATALTCGV